jgi:hypothetical protein
MQLSAAATAAAAILLHMFPLVEDSEHMLKTMEQMMSAVWSLVCLKNTFCFDCSVCKTHVSCWFLAPPYHYVL